MIIGSLIIMCIGLLTLAYGFFLHYKEMTPRSKTLLLIGMFILIVGTILLILGKVGIVR